VRSHERVCAGDEADEANKSKQQHDQRQINKQDDKVRNINQNRKGDKCFIWQWKGKIISPCLTFPEPAGHLGVLLFFFFFFVFGPRWIIISSFLPTGRNVIKGREERKEEEETSP